MSAVLKEASEAIGPARCLSRIVQRVLGASGEGGISAAWVADGRNRRPAWGCSIGYRKRCRLKV